jgi:hypothetical protein
VSAENVEMEIYLVTRWRAVTWRMRLNNILNGKAAIEDLSVLYGTAIRHLEAFEAALEARRRAYGRPAC